MVRSRVPARLAAAGARRGSETPLTKVYEDCSVREVGAFYSGVAFVTRSVGSAWRVNSGTGQESAVASAAGASV